MSQIPLSETHEVFNQAHPLEPYCMYDTDRPLQEAIHREGAEWAEDQIREYGTMAGGPLSEWGFQANEQKPVFHSHDRYGHRIDVVDFHPSYHALMRTAIEHGLHSLPWSEPKPGAHVARAAMSYMHYQAEAGNGCPLTMTFAAIPSLRHQPNLAEEWVPKITARHYDPRNVPYFEKEGLTIGMAMTEKQGGTDVRANSTRATAVAQGGPGEAYELVGHKWFCSAPMCDAFLTLAQTDKGLSCFLLPRWRPDGGKNALYVQRLKNKLGNWATASSEIEYRGAFAWMVGEEGRGVRTIIEMVAMTRFDCMMGSTALMRQALAQAIHHCSLRSVFGKTLLQQPLMLNVLADLALEVEASLAMTMRVARALDHQKDAHERHFARIATAVGKYWICKRTPSMINEAQECLGGAGYVEESILPRLYREAPLNSIWEGSGNVQCLDVLRALQRNPESLQAFFAELQKAGGKHDLMDQAMAGLKEEFKNIEHMEFRARRVVEKMAVCLQGALLLQSAPPEVSEAFCQTRLGRDQGLVYGTLPVGTETDAIVQRHAPLPS